MHTSAMTTLGAMEEFVLALGVTVKEVDGCASKMCGRCMVWRRLDRTVTVCRELPPEERLEGFAEVLAELDVT